MSLRKKFIQLGLKKQAVTVGQLKFLSAGNFLDRDDDSNLLEFLQKISCKTFLDFNAHFAKSPILAHFLSNFVQIDGISQEDIFSVKENIYSHVYKNFSDCCLKHYDGALILEENLSEFDKNCSLLKDNVDIIFTFARKNSKLGKHVRNNVRNFADVRVMPASAGEWIFLYSKRPPEDFAMYVVTHKKLHEFFVQNLPPYYKIIHAGRAGSEDLGFLGDDTGDNISDLNPYINEITALYWMWKNTSHTIIGLNHYRRFFVSNPNGGDIYEKILTEDAAKKILEDYDIGVWHYDFDLPLGLSRMMNGRENFEISVQIIRKYLLRLYPDYIEAFEFTLSTDVYFACNMFFARRYVMDAYCSWLFSFFIDATEEIIETCHLKEEVGNHKRLAGYFCEMMLNVWLVKNRLRVKRMGVTFLTDL